MYRTDSLRYEHCCTHDFSDSTLYPPGRGRYGSKALEELISSIFARNLGPWSESRMRRRNIQAWIISCKSVSFSSRAGRYCTQHTHVFRPDYCSKGMNLRSTNALARPLILSTHLEKRLAQLDDATTLLRVLAHPGTAACGHPLFVRIGEQLTW